MLSCPPHLVKTHIFVLFLTLFYQSLFPFSYSHLLLFATQFALLFRPESKWRSICRFFSKINAVHLPSCLLCPQIFPYARKTYRGKHKWKSQDFHRQGDCIGVTQNANKTGLRGFFMYFFFHLTLRDHHSMLFLKLKNLRRKLWLDFKDIEFFLLV